MESLDRVSGLTKLSSFLDILLDIQLTIDDSSYRQNVDLDKKNEIHYHSWKEHLKMSKNANFGCELL
jgi:hypothetical protein